MRDTTQPNVEAQPESVAWHSLAEIDVLAQLRSSLDGLTSKEAADRLIK